MSTKKINQMRFCLWLGCLIFIIYKIKIKTLFTSFQFPHVKIVCNLSCMRNCKCMELMMNSIYVIFYSISAPNFKVQWWIHFMLCSKMPMDEHDKIPSSSCATSLLGLGVETGRLRKLDEWQASLICCDCFLYFLDYSFENWTEPICTDLALVWNFKTRSCLFFFFLVTKT